MNKFTQFSLVAITLFSVGALRCADGTIFNFSKQAKTVHITHANGKSEDVTITPPLYGSGRYSDVVEIGIKNADGTLVSVYKPQFERFIYTIREDGRGIVENDRIMHGGRAVLRGDSN
ncbi:MAG: hypothetical protein UU47_C0001G0084 [candidate division TM6 bacterium GW2011_GWE2_41_16]|nr:MAG: hypothetical protein UU47_C0001G0084 [candidate division TM6 bacterium GW2011_GWE2_41_16]